MTARGTIETRLADAERRIEELTRRFGSANVSEARLPGNRDDDQIPFKNAAGETIPAYAVMQVSGVLSAGGKTLSVVKPDGSRKRVFMLNGPSDVALGGFGWGRMHSPTAYALYDTSSGTPAYGELWGPTTTWKLSKSQSGFEVIGGNTGAVGSERTRVKQISVGASFFMAFSNSFSGALSGLSTLAPLGSVSPAVPSGAFSVAANVLTVTPAGVYAVFQRADIQSTGGTALNGGTVHGSRPWELTSPGGTTVASFALVDVPYGGFTFSISAIQSFGGDTCEVGNAVLMGWRIA